MTPPEAQAQRGALAALGARASRDAQEAQAPPAGGAGAQAIATGLFMLLPGALREQGADVGEWVARTQAGLLAREADGLHAWPAAAAAPRSGGS